MARYLREADLGGIRDFSLKRRATNRMRSTALFLRPWTSFNSGKLNFRVLTCENPKGSAISSKFGSDHVGFDASVSGVSHRKLQSQQSYGEMAEWSKAHAC
jgi:hypothetical protein